MDENGRKMEKDTALGARAVFYFCVLGTIALAAAFVFFGGYYFRNQADVKGRVVALYGVRPPSDKAGASEVREWIGGYAAAMPGCLCALGRPIGKAPDMALLLCVGLSSGVDSCEIRPEKLPDGVTMKVSAPSTPDARQKMIFLLNRVAGRNIVNPRTDRELRTP